MKKYTAIFVFVLMAAVGMASVAFGENMIINYKSGQTQKIDLNTVQSIEFKGVDRAGHNDPLPGIRTGRPYKLVAKHSGKCLDVAGVSNANGANIIQYDCHGGANQQWTLADRGEGYYLLTARNSGKCLDVSGVSNANGAGVIQYDCHSGPNQQWMLIAQGQGYYMLTAKHSGKCLDVAGASSANGTNIIQYDCHSGPNQLWQLR